VHRLLELEGEQASQARELERVTSLRDSAVEKATKLEAELEAATSQVWGGDFVHRVFFSHAFFAFAWRAEKQTSMDIGYCCAGHAVVRGTGARIGEASGLAGLAGVCGGGATLRHSRT